MFDNNNELLTNPVIAFIQEKIHDPNLLELTITNGSTTILENKSSTSEALPQFKPSDLIDAIDIVNQYNQEAYSHKKSTSFSVKNFILPDGAKITHLDKPEKFGIHYRAPRIYKFHELIEKKFFSPELASWLDEELANNSSFIISNSPVVNYSTDNEFLKSLILRRQMLSNVRTVIVESQPHLTKQLSKVDAMVNPRPQFPSILKNIAAQNYDLLATQLITADEAVEFSLLKNKGIQAIGELKQQYNNLASFPQHLTGVTRQIIPVLAQGIDYVVNVDNAGFHITSVEQLYISNGKIHLNTIWEHDTDVKNNSFWTMRNLPLGKSRKELLTQRPDNYIDLATALNGKDSKNPVLNYLEEILNESDEEVNITIELYDISINEQPIPKEKKFGGNDIVSAQKLLHEKFSNSNFDYIATINDNVTIDSRSVKGGYKKITISKKTFTSVNSIVQKGAGSQEIISWLVHGLKNEANIMISGENPKKSQNVLNALVSKALDYNEKRIVSIGGSLNINIKDSIVLQTSSVADVGLLVKSALRMRPDAIIIEEIALGSHELIVALDENEEQGVSLGDINQNILPLYVGANGHQLLSTIHNSLLQQINTFSNERSKSSFVEGTDFVVEITDQLNGDPYISSIKQPILENNKIIYRPIWETRLDEEGNIVWYKNEVPTRAVRRKLNLDSYIVLDTVPPIQNSVEKDNNVNSTLGANPQLSIISPEEAEDVLDALTKLTSFFQKFIAK